MLLAEKQQILSNVIYREVLGETYFLFHISELANVKNDIPKIIFQQDKSEAFKTNQMFKLSCIFSITICSM